MISIIKKKFVGDALIYSVHPIISKLLTFILIPLYTSFLSPADYGNLQYIMLFGAFLRGVSQMGLNSSFWKFRSQDGINKKQIALNLTLNQLALGVFLLVAYLMFTYVFGNFDTVGLFIALFYVGLVIKTFSENLLLFNRANFQAKKYLKVALFQTILLFSLNILFVKFLALNFQGIIYAYLISFGVTAVLFYKSLQREFDGRYNWSISKEMIVYGFPIMIGNIGLMILSLSDRWFIKHFNTDDELGLYSYGYKFADLILVFIIQIFNMTFIPLAWKLQKKAQAQAVFSEVRNLIYLLFPAISLIALSIILLLAELMTSNKSYMEGLDIIVMIAFSHVFYGFYLFHSLGLQFAKKTKFMVICNGVAVIVNLLLNGLLIPKYGAIGASFATLASYFIMLLITLIYSQRFYPLNFSFLKTIFHFTVLLAFALGVTYVFINNDFSVWFKSLITFSAGVVLTLILLVTSGVTRKTLRKISDITA